MGLQEGGLRSPHTSFPHATPDPAAFSIPRPPSSVGARESGHPRSVNIRADNLSCSFLSRFSFLFWGVGGWGVLWVWCGGGGIWEGGGCGGGMEVVVVTPSSFSSNPDKTSSPLSSPLPPFACIPPPPIPPYSPHPPSSSSLSTTLLYAVFESQDGVLWCPFSGGR